jgi:pyochelin synthetase
MNISDLVGQLEREGARVWEQSGELRFRAPKGVMSDQRRALLQSAKQEVIEHLRNRHGAHVLVPRPDERHAPFPLTEVQSAYLLGRLDAFAFGGVGCHGYGEVFFPEIEPARLQQAWRRVIDRHDMLRARINEDGTQQILAHPPPYTVSIIDVRGADSVQATAELERLRNEMSHRVYQPGETPMFDLRVTLQDNGALLHLSIDFLIADLVSTQIVLDELYRLYRDPDAMLPPIGISFRDYVLADRNRIGEVQYTRDRDHKLAGIDRLPAAPELPTLKARPDGTARFSRNQLSVSPEQWGRLRRRAGDEGITASVAILVAYAEVIGRWSRHPRFTLNLTLQNRQPWHPDVGQVVGDFTSVALLEVDQDLTSPLRTRAMSVQAQLWESLDHRSFSGLQVAREIARRRGPGAALFPIVFTSAIGVNADGKGGVQLGDLVYGITQTPQVWIDCQALERDMGLLINWDVRQGVFPDGLIDEMFAAFDTLVRRMADDPSVWEALDTVPLPPAQADRRRHVNATAGPLPAALLHDGVVAQAQRTPNRTAVVTGDRSLSYAELVGRANGVAEALRERGCASGEVVAVVMDKGWEQVTAVLGALVAGAVYLPIDGFQPRARRDEILADAGVRLVLAQGQSVAGRQFPTTVEVIAIDTLPQSSAPVGRPRAEPDDLAYVIYTSGSTGVPKGVMISHRSALTTIEDINHRFHITEDDVVLGLAHLGFDLSVYDIFGPLAAGGRLVLPDHESARDPSHWAMLLARHGVTLWNSVPAQMQMLYDYLATSASDAERRAISRLRLALLSGDWIPVKLPDQIWDVLPGLEIVSLGGATEAAIWSIFHTIDEVRPEWSSIPYGTPLRNQSFHVLDTVLRPCPELVPGELFIGGAGLARGYFGDDARTAERFIRHPTTGERLYRTGDIGRYLRDGTIEFLGREDRQVKIRGHRIELAEVERALVSHSAVGKAVVLIDGDPPLQRRLVAFVEPARRPEEEEVADDWIQSVTEAALAACDDVLHGVDAEGYREYIRALDRASLAAMLATLAGCELTTARSAAESDVLERIAPRYHRLVRRWLATLIEHGLVERSAERFRATETIPRDKLDRLWADVEHLGQGIEDDSVLAYFRRCASQLGAVLTGLEVPLFLLFPGARVDVSEAIYHHGLLNRAATQMAAATVRQLAAHTPGADVLRLLEVGGGTGAATRDVLAALDPLPVQYLLTDLSPFFLKEARSNLAAYPFVRYGVFDVDKDLRDQDLLPNSFDVVLATDVLHSSRNINVAVERLRELLAPGGWLVFTEMTRDHPAIMISLEFLLDAGGDAGDFLDQRHGRGQTFLAPDVWRAVLADAGVNPIISLPEDDAIVSANGTRLFVGRVKADRARPTTAAILAHVGERLPDFMVPAQVQVLDALPLTVNGKVDQQALRSSLVRRAGEAVEHQPDERMSDLERRLVGLWCDVLSLKGFDHTLGFLEVGGDSLLAARLATRLRNEIPEAAALFFDELLRHILEGPTVAELAAVLTQRSPAVEARADAENDVNDAVSPLQHLAGIDDGRPVVVFVHDGSGRLEVYHEAIDALAEQGSLYGLCVPEPATYLRLAPETLVEHLAQKYVTALGRIADNGVHVVGGGVGSVLAVEVARRLSERGADVLSLTLVDAHPYPGPTAGASAGGHGNSVAAHTAQAVATIDVVPYAGDITLVQASDSPAIPSDAVAFWQDVCLGELAVLERDAFERNGVVRAVRVAVDTNARP